MVSAARLRAAWCQTFDSQGVRVVLTIVSPAPVVHDVTGRWL
jgi:hypothetical protein